MMFTICVLVFSAFGPISTTCNHRMTADDVWKAMEACIMLQECRLETKGARTYHFYVKRQW